MKEVLIKEVNKCDTVIPKDQKSANEDILIYNTVSTHPNIRFD